MRNVTKIAAGLMVSVLAAMNMNAATQVSAPATSHQVMLRITQQQIITYLENTGHTVLTAPVQEGSIWTCYTRLTNGHTAFTTVFTSGDEIIGWEDDIID